MSGYTTDQRVPAFEVLPGESRNYWSVDSGISLAYEVDLFGRVRRSLEAAHGDERAAQGDLDAVRVEVVADTVRAYADAIASSEQITVAKQTVDLLDRSARGDVQPGRRRTFGAARPDPHHRLARPTAG